MTSEYAPFDGDGRTRVTPTTEIRKMRPEAVPITVTRGQARRLIDEFMDKGFVKFDKHGNTLWVIEVWAYQQEYELKVIKHPLGGWKAEFIYEDVA